jgi:hypothetical protein
LLFAVTVLNKVPVPVAFTYCRIVTTLFADIVPTFHVYVGAEAVEGAGTAYWCTSPEGSVSVSVTAGSARLLVFANVMS